MWLADYAQRLSAWTALRQSCQDLALSSALENINQWWQQSPWRPYYLHWDDRNDWPNPWQLLADNEYCDVARALGIVYTIHLLDRVDCSDACMICSDQGNLVLVQDGKYVMNWKSNAIVNIESTQITIQRTLESAVLDRLLR